MVVHTVFLTLGRLRQGDCCEFKAYTVSISVLRKVRLLQTSGEPKYQARLLCPQSSPPLPASHTHRRLPSLQSYPFCSLKSENLEAAASLKPALLLYPRIIYVLISS